MRLFFALWPPREAAAALQVWANAARRASGGRVTRMETIHLTLAFLGDVEAIAVAALKDLQVTGQRHVLSIEQARYWAHNRIVWVGPENTPESLLRLSDFLNRELKERGYRTEERAFEAHVTLIRNAREPAALPRVPSIRWPVDECLLVDSRPAGAGRHYEVLARYALT